MTPGVLETVDRRVLGGFMFVDASTGQPIDAPVTVASSQMKVRANHSGIYAIFDAPGFRALTTQFIPTTPWPALQNFEISVSDASLRYLPRRAQVQAPRVLTGVAAPQPVPLFPGPGSTVEPNWAVVRVSVRSNANASLPFSVVRVIQAPNTVMATGMADQRGEALLAVVGLGLQVSSTDTDPVTETTTAVTIQAWFDPSVLDRPKGWIPNPDDILDNLANPALKTGSMTGAIGARHTLIAGITISV
jgi:hypothetical protein